MLVFVACLLAFAWGSDVDRVTNGQQVLFVFRETQLPNSDAQASIVDTDPKQLLGDLLPGTGISYDRNRPGVQFLAEAGAEERMSSALNISSLLQTVTSALTVELHFDWTRSLGNVLAIGTFPASSVPGTANCLDGSLNFAVDVMDAGIRVLARRSTDCWYTGIDQPVNSGAFHLGLTFSRSPSQFRIYYNGVPITGASPQIDYSAWNPGAHLRLGVPGQNPWQGTIRLLAIYNRTLTAAEIKQNYEAGLPNSRPVTLSRTVSVDEDTLTQIFLPASGFEGLPLNLSLLDLPAPGTGHLFLSSAAQPSDRITSVPFALPAGVTSVWYLPPQDAYGLALTAFRYQATDGLLESDPATVTIDVAPVNDPPVALNGTALADLERPVVINCTGDDPYDRQPFVGRVLITSLPPSGALFESADGHAQGPRITAVPHYLPNSSSTVIYVSQPAPATASGQHLAFQDAFTFRVDDGLLSENTAVISVDVVNTFGALSSTAECTEDTPCPVVLSGTGPAPTGIRLTSLPSKGLLWAGGNASAAGGSPITGPAPVLVPWAPLVYRANLNLHGASLDSFSFQLVRFDLLSNVASVSVDVAPVNDPPSISVTASGPAQQRRNARGELVLNSTIGATFTLAFNIIDPDASPDAVFFARINGTHGINITLAAAGRAKLPVGAMQEGNGVEDRQIAFKAPFAVLSQCLGAVVVKGSASGHQELDLLVLDDALPEPASAQARVLFELQAAPTANPDPGPEPDPRPDPAQPTDKSGSEEFFLLAWLKGDYKWAVYGGAGLIVAACFAFCLWRCARRKRRQVMRTKGVGSAPRKAKKAPYNKVPVTPSKPKQQRKASPPLSEAPGSQPDFSSESHDATSQALPPGVELVSPLKPGSLWAPYSPSSPHAAPLGLQCVDVEEAHLDDSPLEGTPPAENVADDLV